MSIGQKIQSGLARGTEKIGSALFMDNIANEGKSSRIKNETEYLNKTLNTANGKMPAENNKLPIKKILGIDDKVITKPEIQPITNSTEVPNDTKITPDLLKENNILGPNDVAPTPSPISQSLKKVSLNSMLEEASKTNKDLKDNLTTQTSFAQPIVSNRSITNNSTTAIAATATAVPMNGYETWYKPRMNFI
jgi:hypothetical protein